MASFFVKLPIYLDKSKGMSINTFWASNAFQDFTNIVPLYLHKRMVQYSAFSVPILKRTLKFKDFK